MKCQNCAREMDFDVVGTMDMQFSWTVDNCIICHITIKGEKTLVRDLSDNLEGFKNINPYEKEAERIQKELDKLNDYVFDEDGVVKTTLRNRIAQEKEKAKIFKEGMLAHAS